MLSIIRQALASLLLTKYRTTNFATLAKINKPEKSPVIINVCIHRRTIWKTGSYAKYVILLKYIEIIIIIIIIIIITGDAGMQAAIQPDKYVIPQRRSGYILDPTAKPFSPRFPDSAHGVRPRVLPPRSRQKPQWQTSGHWVT